MRFPLLAKAAAIGLIMFVLAGVLMRIDWLVDERRMRQNEALQSVTQSLSSAQTLVGPLLQRQCTEEWDTIEGEGKQRRTVTGRRVVTLHGTPQGLAAQSEATAEARYRGLFKVNGYAGTTTLTAHWKGLGDLQPQREHKGSRLHCEPATVLVALSDPRGIRSAKITIDGATAEVRPGTGHNVHGLGLHAVLGARGRTKPSRRLRCRWRSSSSALRGCLWCQRPTT
jgi:inner membrane protein